MNPRMNSARVTNTEVERFVSNVMVQRLESKPVAAEFDDDPGPQEPAALNAIPGDATRPDGAAPAEVTAWLCRLLQAGDSFYPTGSYAHSFGLEGLVHEGVIHDCTTLREFIFRSALPALQHTELPLAATAGQAFATPDWSRIGELCVLSSALRGSREARRAAESIGRQRAELVAALRGSPLAQEFLRRAAEHHWPHSAAVSAALEGHALGAPPAAVLAGVCYANLSSLLSAAMKLL